MPATYTAEWGGIDQDHASKGVWFEIKGARFLLARAGHGNREFKRKLADAIQHKQKQIRRGSLDIEETDAITQDVFIKVCLLAWENVTDRDGQALELNFNNAKWLFTTLPDLYDDLSGYASDMNAYLVERQVESGNG